MFYRYEIKNNGKEEALYLYLTMTYEFSKELEDNTKEGAINKKAKDFIQNNSIDFHGDKVYLVVDGIVIKTLNINKEYIVKEIPNSNKYLNKNFIIHLKYFNDHMEDLTLEDYLLGVLATNAIKNLELTTLKALCILYRTYAYKMMAKYRYINVYNEFQIYKPISYYKVIWFDSYQDNYNKLLKAVTDTDGEFLTYDNQYINPYIHICSNGKTTKESSIPYLDSVNSLWDYAYKDFLNIVDFDYPTLEEKLKIKKQDLMKIKVVEATDNSTIKLIKIKDKQYTGDEFRNLLGLKSCDMIIIVNPTFMRLITRGYGKNMGLSQYGANEIAKSGCSYHSILKYYFPKVMIKKHI